ncbi:hypothetical protein BN946_scf184875.g11 [Trametes cinnabarina]|uniref:Uncharacterized protein n=1 Tax=Pycnoporus cinnabarinus TaxID=5643 RepID=A0A060SB44_PYCCI|nr:hypothetical protein BN946_scf184875.g11 [Trametes cinnabarina]
MSYESIEFVHHDALTEAAAAEARPQTRWESLKQQFRCALNAGLEKCTGLPGAHMSWTTDGFATRVVAGYGFTLPNWPSNIPFDDPSSIEGGVRSLETLLEAWFDPKSGFTFVPATAEQRAIAKAMPQMVHPNVKLIKTERKRSPRAIVVAPVVLHPSALIPLGCHPTSTIPAEIDNGPRSQRIDVKKPRKPRIPHPYKRTPMLPKRGVTSKRFVIELEEDAENPASVPGGSSSAVVSGRRGGGQGDYLAVNDVIYPFFQYVPVHDMFLEA